jgi:hypothetical protein
MKASEYSSLRYIIPNLWSYLLALPYLRHTFPFIGAWARHPPMADAMGLSRHIFYEPVIGLVISQPFLILGIVSLKAFGREDAGMARWLTLCVLAGALLGFLPALAVQGSTMRYLMDTVPCLTILAALGYWHLLADKPRWGRAIHTILILIIFLQSVLGLLLGWTGYRNHFATFNPGLNNALRSFFPTLNF